MENRLGMILIAAGLCILLFPLVTRIQGEIYQQRLERELLEESLEYRNPSADEAAWEVEETEKAEYYARTKRFPSVRIVIPKIGLNAVVVEGIDSRSLRKGPGHVPGTANPGVSGNCCIAGHRNLYGSWFRELDDLETGDAVMLRTPDAEYEYQVLDVFSVGSADTAVFDQTVPPTLTLVTCMPGARTRSRLVVVAELSAQR